MANGLFLPSPTSTRKTSRTERRRAVVPQFTIPGLTPTPTPAQGLATQMNVPLIQGSPIQLPAGLQAMPWQTPAPGVTQAAEGPGLRQGLYEMYGVTSAIPDYVPPPTPTAPPTVGGYGGYGRGGGGVAPQEIVPLHEIKWKEGSFDLENARAPEWWHPVIPQNAEDMKRPDVSYLAMLNASIPYLSPEDQRNAAAQLYATDADNFSFYKPDKLTGKTPITKETSLLSERYKEKPEEFEIIDRGYFQSAGRGTGFINALNQLREQTVGGERHDIAGTGQPYTWLQQVAGVLESFGGDMPSSRKLPSKGPLSRSRYLSMISALDPLLAMGKSANIGATANIGRMFAQPFFSQGALMPMSQQAGIKRFGLRNPALF